MKRHIALFLLLVAAVLTTNAQYKGFAFGISYQQIDSPNNVAYLRAIENKVGLSSHLELGRLGGVAVYFTNKAEENKEVEAGVSFSSKYEVFTNDSGLKMSVQNNYMALRFGYNFYPTRWCFVGAQFAVNNFNGKVKYNDPASDTLFDFVEDNINIFIGYAVSLRPQAGFVIPFTAKNTSKDFGMRVLGFYDFGLSRYNYYESYDKIMLYDGPKKTTSRGYGLEVTVFFRHG